MTKTADDIEGSPDSMIVVVVRKLGDLQEQINELKKMQNKLTQMVEQVITTNRQRNEMFRRIRRLEKLSNLPSELDDADTDYS